MPGGDASPSGRVSWPREREGGPFSDAALRRAPLEFTCQSPATHRVRIRSSRALFRLGMAHHRPRQRAAHGRSVPPFASGRGRSPSACLRMRPHPSIASFASVHRVHRVAASAASGHLRRSREMRLVSPAAWHWERRTCLWRMGIIASLFQGIQGAAAPQAPGDRSRQGIHGYSPGYSKESSHESASIGQAALRRLQGDPPSPGGDGHLQQKPEAQTASGLSARADGAAPKPRNGPAARRAGVLMRLC